MYDPDNKRYPMLTNEEKLWDKVNHTRFLELVNKSNKVVESHRSDNNFGEFLFVTLVFGKVVITFYGAGYHDGKDKNINSVWYFYETPSSDFYRGKKAMNKNKVLDQIAFEVDQYPDLGYQSEYGQAFSLLASLGDEDSAYTNIDDFMDLFGE